ncbi:MAG: hypothetical protein JNM34_05230 [Chthonomonadaceae bacterium]|nr:hypothetical protein [Chthonomonadaceae bacterium]
MGARSRDTLAWGRDSVAKRVQNIGSQGMPDGRVPEPGGWNRLVVIVEVCEDFARMLSSLGVRLRSEPVSGAWRDAGVGRRPGW